MTKQSQKWFGRFAIFFLAIMVPVNALASIVTEDANQGIKYSGAWVPTHRNGPSDVLVFEKNPEMVPDFHAYIYDFGNRENRLELFTEDSFSNIVFGDGSTSTWSAYTKINGEQQELSLGENPEFGIFFVDNAGTVFDEYFITGDSGGYTLTNVDMESNIELVIHDAERVNTPIPGAALLLGTGLFSLAAVRTRYRRTT